VPNRILLVDDEPGVRFGMRDFLEAEGFDVDEADSCAAALEAVHTSRPDAAVVDYALPDGNALVLLHRLREIDPLLPVVILTGHGSIELAVRSMKEGAEQFLTKPVDLTALAAILRRALEHQRNRQKQLAGRSRAAREAADPFLGSSALIRELADQARKVVETDSPILIQGATGTGKGVLAAWLHEHSRRADEAFVDLNCAALSREFLETELFGHEKGAFTGAVQSKPGLLEVAQRGTVFLDEIGDMDLEVQPKLLKVIEEKRFRRLGDVRDRHTDIRLITATHQNLSAMVREKKFRSDLYFRISTIPLAIPRLQDRADDIPVLARHLLGRLSADLARHGVELAPDAERALQEYSWPGNIRELRNVLERALILTEGSVLARRALRFDSRSDGSAESVVPSSLTLVELERIHIETVLLEERGRVDHAAVRLGIPRSSLYQKIKKHGIVLSRFQTLV